MTVDYARREPVQIRETERKSVERLAQVLKRGADAPESLRLLWEERLAQLLKKGKTRLTRPSGVEIPLTESVYRVLRQAVEIMASGRAVSIVPHDLLLTTQQAADLLNISRPYLIRLLEEGEIPFERVGTHRRIRIADLLRYKARRDRERRRHLDELARLSEDLGLYDRG